MIKLRDYQNLAVANVIGDWDRGQDRNALVMATGTGKTATAANIVGRRAEQGPVLWLAHREELIDQAAGTLSAYGLDVGVMAADRNETGHQVIVGSVPTLARARRRADLPQVGTVVVDEAHHSGARTYMDVLGHAGMFDGRAQGLGLSATLTRSSGTALGEIWQGVSFQYDILDAINDGYLVDVVGHQVIVDGMSLQELKMTAGDFALTPLSELVSTPEAITAVLSSHMEHARGMKTMVFTPNLACARLYAAAFSAEGYRTYIVEGAMPKDERRRIMDLARAGEVDILVNCMVLTEGTDLPPFQCAVIVRPTTQAALYVQMVGRVLRLYPGKDTAVVLDVVGAAADHRLATIADLSSRRLASVGKGETLIQAAKREVAERNPALTGYVVSTREFDLFGKSRAAWLQTHEGLWFIPAGDTAVFLWPGDVEGMYHLGWVSLHRGSSYGWLHMNLPFDVLMDLGEAEADTRARAWGERNGYKLNPASRANGKRRTPPSQGSLTWANNLGIEVPDGVTAGELSRIIDIERASRVLDCRIRK